MQFEITREQLVSSPQHSGPVIKQFNLSEKKPLVFQKFKKKELSYQLGKKEYQPSLILSKLGKTPCRSHFILIQTLKLIPLVY